MQKRYCVNQRNKVVFYVVLLEPLTHLVTLKGEEKHLCPVLQQQACLDTFTHPRCTACFFLPRAYLFCIWSGLSHKKSERWATILGTATFNLRACGRCQVSAQAINDLWFAWPTCKKHTRHKHAKRDKHSAHTSFPIKAD